MSYWTIPQEMQLPAMKTKSSGKKSLFLNLVLPFSLALLGIPLYLMVILKLVALLQ